MRHLLQFFVDVIEAEHPPEGFVGERHFHRPLARTANEARLRGRTFDAQHELLLLIKNREPPGPLSFPPMGESRTLLSDAFG